MTTATAQNQNMCRSPGPTTPEKPVPWLFMPRARVLEPRAQVAGAESPH